ncbi:MAG: type II toxin-antitoxin system VapC family toxin [Betaproteobacteria bacterium]|nr:type II toxin-antitoxin system VapC family toxin [Betaproteobacteria bacterium]
MIYADTSALVPAFIREPKSDAVLAWIESSGERLIVSEWAIAEFSSAAAIKVRTGQAAPGIAKQARERFLAFVERHCAIAVPQRSEFRRAADLAGVPELNLRTGDALHLAIAEASNVQGILCLDQIMSNGAKAIGLVVVTV